MMKSLLIRNQMAFVLFQDVLMEILILFKAGVITNFNTIQVAKMDIQKTVIKIKIPLKMLL